MNYTDEQFEDAFGTALKREASSLRPPAALLQAALTQSSLRKTFSPATLVSRWGLVRMAFTGFAVMVFLVGSAEIGFEANREVNYALFVSEVEAAEIGLALDEAEIAESEGELIAVDLALDENE